ncbi:MAG: ROK family protein [Ruminococcaceae bacterium]|nr:ROK family protein [Oscillospiraceae bacterium]
MYIGVDLGGTNIAAGVVDEAGKILAEGSVPTGAERPYQEIIKDMADLCKEITKKAGLEISDIRAIGIGSPGTIDNENGVVVYSNNIKMEHAPIAAELQKYINVPVNMENDANAAAMGEYVVNGGDVDSFIFITLGTGVGGGIVLNKKIYRGFNCAGAELGHITLIHNGQPCTCGNNGCWEAYASVTALIRQTKEAIEKNPDSLMAKLAEKEGKVSGRTAFDAAKQGDAAAQAVVDQYIEYVADGLLSIVNIFQPEKLVIGGGISKEGDYLLNPIREYIKKYDYNKYMPRVDISIATLFNDAGIIGAALAAKQ